MGQLGVLNEIILIYLTLGQARGPCSVMLVLFPWDRSGKPTGDAMWWSKDPRLWVCLVWNSSLSSHTSNQQRFWELPNWQRARPKIWDGEFLLQSPTQQYPHVVEFFSSCSSTIMGLSGLIINFNLEHIIASFPINNKLSYLHPYFLICGSFSSISQKWHKDVLHFHTWYIISQHGPCGLYNNLAVEIKPLHWGESKSVGMEKVHFIFMLMFWKQVMIMVQYSVLGCFSSLLKSRQLLDSTC